MPIPSGLGAADQFPVETEAPAGVSAKLLQSGRMVGQQPLKPSGLSEQKGDMDVESWCPPIKRAVWGGIEIATFKVMQDATVNRRRSRDPCGC